MHPYLTQKNLLRYALESGLQVMSFSWTTVEEGVIVQPVVQEIAAKYSKTPAQVVLRWGVQRGTSVIPKSSKVERLQENINILDFQLTQDEMDQISALNKNRRFNDPAFFTTGMNCWTPIYD